MSEPSVIIVGAGIAGLSAGCYARMNGYRTTILEAHRIPGGLCTAWTRKGYTFDISMHVFMHAKHGPFHAMWSELGALQGRSFHYHPEFGRIESRGRTVVYGTDGAALEQQLLALSPADAPLIRQFVRLLHGPGFQDLMPVDPAALTRPLDRVRSLAGLLPLLPTLLRCGKETIQEFAARFRDPFLRQAVRFVIDAPGWPMVGFPLVGLSGFFNARANDVSVPLGGSQGVVLAIADRFRALGGELRLGTRVADLIVETDRAAGVRLEDGTELRADTVIWAADGHHLIFDLLKGRYVNDAVRTMYERWVPVRPLVHVCLGVKRDLSGEPARVVYELEEPLTVAGEARRWLAVIHHAFDPSSAPAGKTAVEVWYPTDFDYWEQLGGDRKAYRAEKKRIADLTVRALEQRWPGIGGDVEVVDVPTPLTYVRYTGNWQGSPDGWYISADNSRAEPLRTLPGLSDLLMVGQWTAPFAGTPLGALTGRQAIQLLCHRDGVPFQTSRPG